MKSAWLSYGYALGWTLLIYGTVPLVRGFQRFVYGSVGKSAFGYFVLGVVAAGGIWSVFYLRRRRGGVRNYLWLAGVAGLYVYFTIRLWNIPEEALHFVEYGVLSYLVYKALLHHVRDVTIYFSAAFVVLFLGTIDEIIQWLVPFRFWDFKDVWLNFLSGCLFQLGLWKGIRPDLITGRVSVKSVRILSGAVAASIILLGLCVSTTPPRVAYISERVPGFSFLKKKGSMMSETGYKHRDPDIGVFYSRFTKRGLRGVDGEKGVGYARVLDENRDLEYGEFLKKYNPVTAPFLYEMRVRLFRRERYEERGQVSEDGGQRTEDGGQRPEDRGRMAEDGRRKTDDGRRRGEFWRVAYRENLILERYFGETLRGSGYRWSEERKREIGEWVDLGGDYESPVSKQLFVRFTERGVWWVIGGILGVLVLVNVFYGRVQGAVVRGQRTEDGGRKAEDG